ncbi:cell adhesion molecule CEACAM5-like [Rhinoderma darwinii]|uniref:cell adhesion molecule CEACAM5-like n=1 Tax=Rhinoderma darwinii TaxID=43563 RepID=UPI003F673534
MGIRQVLLCWTVFIFSLVLASPTKVVNETLGGYVDFDVFVPLPEIYHIEWTFGETGNVTVAAQIYIGEFPQFHPQYRGRCELFTNGTLRLNNLTYADEGDYNLYVFDQNNFTTHIQLYELQLFPILHAPFLRNMSDRSVAGTNVTLQCDAGNQNVTTYTFYRDQKTICTEPHVICRGSFLDFRLITGNDNGNYTCSIQNPVSTSTSNSLNVTVSVPVSAVTLTTNTSNLLLWPGRDFVSLWCASNGTDVSYSWSRDRAPLPQNPQYQFTLNSSMLIIRPVSTEDNGYFMCTATNWINSENSTKLYLNLASPVSAVTLTSNASGVLRAGEDSVSLYCSAQGSAITFFWSLNGKPVPPNPPYYITQSDSPPNSNLTIRPVSKNDTGPFTCTATNLENSETSNALSLSLASILHAPSLHILSDRIVAGTNVTLQCDAGNQNVTTYTFYRDQKTICTEPHVICRGSFLDFRPITGNDNGIYTCSIQNPVSTSTSNSQNLAVSVPVSAVTLTTNTSNLLLWPGRDSVSLWCSSNGTDVSYSWSRDGAPLPQNPQYQFTLNSYMLIIMPVSTEDNGYFMCTATNWINSENSTKLYLNLASPISAVTLTSNTSGVVWAGEDSVSLYCSAQGSVIAFSWSLNGKPVPPNPPYYITQSDSPPNSNLTIRPVSKNDTGPFTCTATNLANSETSNALSLPLALNMNNIVYIQRIETSTSHG